MSEPLLASKLCIPPLRAQLVSRPRLLTKLDSGLRDGCRLILVSAPAGYGKTTMIAEWVRQGDFPVAWVSLEEGDNDPARFQEYLLAALSTVRPGLDVELQTILQPSHRRSLSSILAPLVNEIFDRPFLLVFDDYHFIRDQSVHDAVSFLIEHMAPHSHMVIITRADPPLPVARWRGRGQVNEIRQYDLQFTIAEAAHFVELVLGTGLDQADASTLARRTEGWAAGLQMAAVSLRGRKDYSAFIHHLTGSSRYIMDYLLEEVLQHQPETIQDFLLQTSILDRMSAGLCANIMQSDEATDQDCQRILGQLERENLFIVQLDDQREWYRYHRLFGDLLSRRLHLKKPELVPQLHHRASLWLERHGVLSAAVEHALSARDYGRAADLVEKAAESVLMRSEMATFFHWMDNLPEREIIERPALCIYHAWALLWRGAPVEDVEAHLATAASVKAFQDRAAPLQAFIALFKGQIKIAADLSRRALAQLPEDESLLRGLARVMEANAIQAEGKTQEAIKTFEEIIRDCQQSGNWLVAVLVLCDLGDLRQKQGLLNLANDLYQQALDLSLDEQGQRLPIAGKALIGLGDIARERNDLATAERLLVEGIKLSESWSVLASFGGHLALGLVYQAMGDLDSARRSLMVLREIARQFDATEYDDYIVEMWEARFYLAQGDLSVARAWAVRTGFAGELDAILEYVPEDVGLYRLRKYEFPVLARLWYQEGRHQDVLSLLDHQFILAEKAERGFLILEVYLLKALAYHAQGNLKQALGALRQALQLAEPHNFIRTFLDEGEPMARLLSEAKTQFEPGVLRNYCARLLAAFQPLDATPVQVSPRVMEYWIEPLSEREQEVLLLLPSGLSGSQMADRLVVSVHTLRSHLKSIYAKLGVHSRYEAVARGKELGLL